MTIENAKADALRKQIAELSWEFKFNAAGVISSPGKFVGEPIETVYFYDVWLNGDGDNILENGEVIGTVFELTDIERHVFEAPQNAIGYALYETSMGFIDGEYVLAEIAGAE